MTKKQKKTLWQIMIATALVIAVQFIPAEGLPKLLLYLIPYFVIGHSILYKAARGIFRGRVFDENFLMAVATVGALIIGALSTSDYLEAVAVLLFYQVGELFQSYAVGKSRKNISALMDIRPEYANVEIDGELVKCDPEDIAVGTIIIVRPGEKIPIDGVVCSGKSSINTGALTGESMPRDVRVGDEVISGSVNLSGVLELRTTKIFSESCVSRILELVENAASNKSRSEDFITKFSRYYTPVVCFSAVALALIPPIFGLCFFGGGDFVTWIYRALSFLVASCPCALLVSIPLTFFAGIGGGAKAGILVKGSNHLEILSKCEYMVFDKTGTLTEGNFRVVAVHEGALKREDIIRYAAMTEWGSAHPIADSLRREWGGDIDFSSVSDAGEISGGGITATIDGHSVAVGNSTLMASFNISAPECHKVGTVVHVAVDNEYAGHIVIADMPKKNAGAAISSLRECGIKKTFMLTGDRAAVADAVGAELGIDKVYSGLLPADKVEKITDIIENKTTSGIVAFVGDGINDAPVLSRADVGVAMGAIGSDAAIEAADVVIMDDDPAKLASAVKLSRRCLGIVYQNIIMSIGIKILALILVALGIANMWLAVFADVGVMILAVLNAARALLPLK